MSIRSTKYEALASVWMIFTVLAFAACGQSSSDGSGAGGAANATGGGANGSGGADLSVGGTPFMSLAGKDSGACKKTGEPCTLTGDCCTGNLCNRYGPAPEWIGCQIACTQNSECQSGCCYQFQGNNGGFCTDAKWCTCGGTGAACSSTSPPCCQTHQCQGDQCRQKCAQNSDCDTQCCVPVPLLPGVSTCMDRMYCP